MKKYQFVFILFFCIGLLQIYIFQQKNKQYSYPKLQIEATAENQLPASTETIITPTPIPLKEPDIRLTTSQILLFGKIIDSQSPIFLIIVEAISVLFFGGIMAIILEIQNRRYQQKSTLKITNYEKSRYLLGIIKEVEKFHKNFYVFEIILAKEKSGESFAKDEELPGFFSEINSFIDLEITLFWDTIFSSGLLPSILEADLLIEIVDYYYQRKSLVGLFAEFKKYSEEISSAENLTRRFLELDWHEIFTKNAFPEINRFVIVSRKIIDRILTELNKLGVEYKVNFDIENKNNSIKKEESEFKNIFIEKFDENISSIKLKYEDSGTKDLDEIPVNSIKFNIRLKLSEKPPENWGKEIRLRRELCGEGEDESNYEIYEYRDYYPFGYSTIDVDIKGQYLVLDCDHLTLIKILPLIKSEIERFNNQYRGFLADEQKKKKRELDIQMSEHKAIMKIKQLIDMSLIEE